MSEEENVLYFEFMGLTFPLRVKLYFKILPIVWIVELVILLISIAIFNYEMTNADLPGGLLSGLLLSYMIQLLI